MTLHACPRVPEQGFIEVLASWCFQPEPISVLTARIRTMDLLAELEVPQTFEAQAIVDELAANAVVHAKTDFEVAIERWNNRIRIIVRDSSELEPQMQTPDLLAESGRGLFMIDGFADSWGYHPSEQGKCIWADLAVNF
jgi:anti-sigma regulatory factor (Ser/Thr protein kinase)